MDRREAIHVLKSPETPAYRLLSALLVVVPSAFDWEPEAVFAELEDQGIETTELLQDKLQAAIVCVTTDKFYLDPRVFENVCTAFANLYVHADILQEPEVRHMAWAAEAVTRLRKGRKRKLASPNDDVERYTAVVLHRAGFMLAPDSLDFAQEDLDNLNANNKLSKLVKKRWKDEKSDFASKKYLEDPVGIQLSRLAEVQTYLDHRLAQ